MPFDSETFRPTADPLDLDAMIAWLEAMPATDWYDFCASSRCLMTQFFQSRHASVKPSTEWDNKAFTARLSYVLDGIVVAVPEAWARIAAGADTYGAALSRFRALREG